MATQDSPNLYERLGGIYSIATVVDDLIDRVMADQRLNANPLVDEAAPQGTTDRLQVPGYRDAMLGRRRSAEIHR